MTLQAMRAQLDFCCKPESNRQLFVLQKRPKAELPTHPKGEVE